MQAIAVIRSGSLPSQGASPLAIEATQFGVGLYCLALGTLMLVAPHVFHAGMYQAFHPALPWWGMLFTIGAVGIGLASMRAVDGPMRMLLHVPSVAGLLAIAGVWLSLRAWSIAAAYGILTGATVYAATQRAPADDDTPPSVDLLPLTFGLIGIVSGVSMLVEPGGVSLRGLDPTLLGVLFGLSYILSGGVMLLAHLRRGKLPRASAVAQISLAALLVIMCALIFVAGPRAWITLVFTIAFAPILAAQPWLGPRLHHAIRSFRARVALLAMSAAALPLIATVSLVSGQQDRASVSEAIDSEVNAAENTARDLDRYIDSRMAAIAAIAGQPGLISRPIDEQRIMLQATSRAYPDIANVALFDQNGTQLARSDGGALVQPEPGSEGRALYDSLQDSDRPIVAVVRKAGTHAPVMAIGVPILGARGEFLGTVIGGPSIGQLNRIIDRSAKSPGRQTYVVDEQGRAVANQDTRLVIEGADFSSRPPVQALLAAAPQGGFSYGGMSDRQLAGIARLSNTGWGVISERPAVEALADDQRSREVVFGILWLAILISAGAGALMASRLVRPLRLLGQAATDFGSGVQRQLPTANTREISTLIAEIDRMRQSIAVREQDLQAAELHYRHLFEGSPAPAWIMDRHTLQFLDVNEATIRALGYSRAQLLDMRFGQLRLELDSDPLESNVGGMERHRLLRGPSAGENQIMDVEITARPITFRGREALLTVMHDITERAQAVALRDEFFSIAAHELKTPITVLRGQSQLNLRRLARNGGMMLDQVGIAFTTIDEQSRKLQRLVDQLLDVSRIESGRLRLDVEETNVVSIVRSAVESARLRGGNRPVEMSSPDEVIARVDPMRLEQVLANLLDNALKYSPATESIEVAVSTSQASPFTDVENGATSVVRIEVRDYGRGIPDQDHERIFQRFQQVHANDQVKGFGLGLYVCRQIVELHGGVIQVESAGNGTRFIVTLPIEARVFAEVAE